MSLCRKLIAALFFFIASINVGQASESERIWLDRADVCFDVRKFQDTMLIVGKENGQEKFSTTISSDSFQNFTDNSQNNFYLKKLEEVLSFQYQSETGGFFEVLISLMGDMELLSSAKTNPEFSEGKTYGFNTCGTLVNKGVQAFGNLVVSAKQIHNYGTIQTSGVRLFQNYMFNSGVLKFGESPEELLDLSLTMPTNSTAQPKFQKGIIENYGTLITNRTFNVKDATQYHEHGISDFEGLEMSGGDMNVSGRTNVRGALQGSVPNIVINDNAKLLTGTFNISPIESLSIGRDSELFIKNKSSLTVSGNYSNSGAISSGSNLTLKLKKKPNDVGIVAAKELLEYICEQMEEAKNTIEEHEANQKTQFKGKLIAKKIKITHHTDHYLNTITDHYNVTKDQYGREVSRVFSHQTETGYVWQKRTTEVEEFFEQLSQEITDYIDNKAKEMDALKEKLDELAKLARAIKSNQLPQELLDVLYAAEKNRKFYAALTVQLTNAGMTKDDINFLYRDPILEALRDFKNRQDDVYPELYDVADNLRIETYDLSKLLDSDAQRFINDYVIPTLTVVACCIPGPHQVATIPAAYGMVAVRLAPVIGRVALAYGTVDAYNKATTFLNEKAKHGGNGKNVELGKEDRVIPNHPAQRMFIENKMKTKEWSKLNGRMIYEDKSGTRFIPTKEKFEFEVGQKISGKWTHIGILRGEGQGAGEILKKFAKGLSYGKYFE